jgi:aspartate 1-decarboxylase
MISMNGAAAHKANPGDRVIICAYGLFDAAEIEHHAPKLVYLNSKNGVVRTANTIPVQAA